MGIFQDVFELPYQLYVAHDSGPQDAARTIVFWHGIAADSSTWSAALSEIQRTKELVDIRLVCIDLLGFGRSPISQNASYSQKLYLKSLAKTLRKLHIREFTLVGHSMGALLAAEFARQYPYKIDQLVLLAPPFLLPTENKKLANRFYHQTFAEIGRHSVSKSLDPIAKMAEKFSSFKATRFNTPAFRRSMDSVILSDKPMQAALQLQVPTDIIVGNFDVLIISANLRYIAKNNPNVKLRMVTAGHDVRGEMVKALIETLKA